MDLWNMYGGEPWLDNNPQLYLFNKGRKRRKTVHKKGRKAMARRRGRTTKRRGYRRRAAPRVRRRVTRRRRRAVMRSNPPRHYRRRRRAVSRRRSSLRRYRRNPGLIAGLNLTQLLTGGAAVIVSPMIEKQLLPFLPASITGTSYGRWAVKLGAALGTWYVAKAALGRRASDVVAIALGSSLVADAVQEFMPTLRLSAYQNVRGYTPGGLRGGLGLVMPGQVTRNRGMGLYGNMGPNSMVRMGALRNTNVFEPPF